ncbi:Aste57867_23801 [Aphanomyces stellatus]|uniref:Aste57867_23801 protein n=1 Tax=Aphanomyces stellatus TaxID=120398 RepID=A0A485LQB2_9STRA|nr:hypothetical protein As57867_023728 [Aphanomyces stellatus]VFU00446.1 Aste57867_23801 [Aphanomyces stellatus]
MELFPKSSVKYAACAQASPKVTPYSGLGQLPFDDEDETPLPPPIPMATTDPILHRMMMPRPASPYTNQTEELELSSSQSPRERSTWTSMADHVIDVEPHDGDASIHVVPAPVGPVCLITCRRKTTFEARVRLTPESTTIYVGRYKGEQAAWDACGRLLRQSTPRRPPSRK